MSLPPLVPSPGAQQQQQQQQLQQQLLQQLQQPLQPPQQPTLPLDDGSVGIRPAAVTNKRRGSLIDTIGTLMSPLDHHDSQRRRLISPSLDDRGRVASSSSLNYSPFMRSNSFKKSPSVEAVTAEMFGTASPALPPTGDGSPRPGFRRAYSHNQSLNGELQQPQQQSQAPSEYFFPERRFSSPSIRAVLNFDSDSGAAAAVDKNQQRSPRTSRIILADRDARNMNTGSNGDSPSSSALNNTSSSGGRSPLLKSLTPSSPPISFMTPPMALSTPIKRPLMGVLPSKMIQQQQQYQQQQQQKTPAYHVNPFTPEIPMRQLAAASLPTPQASPSTPVNTSTSYSSASSMKSSPASYRYGSLFKTLPSSAPVGGSMGISEGSEDGAQAEDAMASLYESMFIQMEQIGRGSYGTVFRCLHRFDGCIYAVKVMKKYNKSKSLRQVVYREAYAMAAINQVNNPNILRYYMSWEDTQHVYIQTELCVGGSVELRKSPNDPNMTVSVPRAIDDLITMLLHVSNGLREIHSRGFAHLDIKPDNIFLSDGVYKIGDFGLLVKALNTATVSEGDSKYLPQELLKNNLSDYDLRRCDMFSLGASIYELALGRPLPSEQIEWQSFREETVPYLNGFSPEFNLLLQQLTAHDPSQRPTAIDILQHPFASTTHARVQQLLSIIDMHGITLPDHLRSTY